jgi:uncharacterized membrane protein YheB (UPF0754 family)
MHCCLFFIPFIAALVGWLINSLFIKLLFHPVLPKKILGFSFQGIVPKKQKIIAKQLGKYVSEDLFSFDVIEQKLTNPSNIEKILPLVEEQIDHFLRKKLTEQMPMISMFIGDKTIEQFKNIFIEELNILFPSLINQYVKNLKSDLNLEQIISEKISSIDITLLENQIKNNFKKEFTYFKLAGAFTGLIIGIIQLLIVLFAN